MSVEPGPVGPTPRRSAARAWALWLTLAIVWSVALVVPVPTPTLFGATDEVRAQIKFLVAKAVHVITYAGWTVLTSRLRATPPVRLLLLYFLLSHAVVSEWAQSQVGYRDGSLRDAALDHLGVLLGLLGSWRRWTKVARAGRE